MPRALSELEQVVLGVIARQQPCTAYVVRHAFQDSLSAHWSSSAGSIYPLLRRLARSGLVRTRARSGDGRASRTLSLTPAGEQALQRWVADLPPPEGLITYDPLRTRFLFLKSLSTSAARTAARLAQQNLRKALAQVRARRRAEERRDVMLALTLRSGELSLLAQLRWLREVRAALPAGHADRARRSAPK